MILTRHCKMNIRFIYGIIAVILLAALSFAISTSNFGNIIAAGNVTAVYYFGDGSHLTGVSTSTNDTFGLYYNKTGTTYDGDLAAGGFTGYEAGNYICDQAFNGTHFCSGVELLNTIRFKNVSAITEWTGYAWYSTGSGAKYAPATIPFSDCDGWQNSTGYYGGNFFKFDDNSHGAITCDSSKALSCCSDEV